MTTARLQGLNDRYDGAAAVDIVRDALDEFAGRIALVSSFGTESAVLLHIIASIDPATPVVFLDTGKLFGETRRYRDQLIKQLGLTGVRSITPDPDEVAKRDPKGILWSQNPNACCALRKVVPLQRALEPFEAWFTGRKAYQATTRATLPAVELAEQRFKINPLVSWTRGDIQAYFAANDLPHHPLEADGYPSVGCMPCTTRVAQGEDIRAGRWRGTQKDECGIHLPLGQALATS